MVPIVIMDDGNANTPIIVVSYDLDELTLGQSSHIQHTLQSFV